MDWCIQQIFCLIELPILSRGPTHLMEIYPELVVQHDASTQADMFLACSSPKEPATPVILDSSYSQTIISLVQNFGKIVTQRTKAPKLVYIFLSIHLTILEGVPSPTNPTPPNNRPSEECKHHN